jgi:hypothetical protein
VSPKKARVSPEKTMCECPKKDVSVFPIPFLSGNGFTATTMQMHENSSATELNGDANTTEVQRISAFY